jgi:hypothetical protein
MQAELAVRRVSGTWPIPAVRAVAADGTWYESDYMQATSLNRLSASVDRGRAVAQAFETLGQWLERSLTVVPIATYAGAVCHEIVTRLEQGSLFTPSDRQAVDSWIAKAQEILHCTKKGDAAVDLAWGHGDFQPGNMLIDTDGRVWIVDWEHTGQRQLAYDYLVFGLRSRFPAGLAVRIEDAWHNVEGLLDTLPVVHPRLPAVMRDATHRKQVFALFLLEDLLWNIQENSSPSFRQQSGAWLQYKKQMAPALAALAAKGSSPDGH